MAIRVKKTKNKEGKQVVYYFAVVWSSALQKPVYSRSFRTRKEAVIEEARMIRSGDLGKRRDKNITVGEVYQLWYASYKGRYAERTANAHKYNWKHYCGYFEKLPITSVKPIDIVQWRNQMTEKFKPETVNKCFSLLANIFGFARDTLQAIDQAPTDHVARCRVKTEVKQTWTEQQIKAFLNYEKVKESPYYAAMMLLCATGMRPGEVCGLTVGDLTENGTLTLHQGLNAYGHVTEMKTERSHRTVAISTGLQCLLRETIAANRLSLPRPNEPIFKTMSGKPLTPDWLSRIFKTLVQEYNGGNRVLLPEIRLYDLRHSFATNCLEDGQKSKVISEVMGNSVSTMEHHYAHLREHMHEELLSEYMSKIV